MFSAHAAAGVRDLSAQERVTTNVMAHDIANEIDTLFKNIKCGQNNDEFIAQACKLDDKPAKSLILFYIAEYKIQEYLLDFQEKMDKISAETGRKVKHETYDNDHGQVMHVWWLDRGELDDKKCKWDFAKRQACFYPDEFKEFRIEFFEGDSDNNQELTMQTLTVHIDNPGDNKTNFVDISFNASYYNLSNNSAVVNVDGNEYKYDAFYKWQNQTVQDIHDGMFIKVPRKERREQQKTLSKNSPFRPIKWRTDDSKEWPSLILPEVIVFGQTIDASVYSD